MAGLKSNLNFIIIILVIIVVDVVGGYIIGKKVLVPYAYNTPESMMESESAGIEEGEVSSEPGLRRELEAINLNPANSAGEVFSCQITLEAASQEVIDELTLRDPQVKDIILTYLSFKTIPEISDVSRREEYRKDIIEKINSVLTSGQISNLYITQWILQ